MSRTLGGETALSVAAGTREAAGARGEDGAFAGFQGAGRDEEDELEFNEGAHDGRVIWIGKRSRYTLLGESTLLRRRIDGRRFEMC